MTRLLAITVLLLAQPLTTVAHDINVTGVARVFLDEEASSEDSTSYRLSIVDQQVPPLFDIERVLPPRCEGLAPARFAYRFSCEPALNVDDTLAFPWPFEGLVVIARWSDGDSVSGYFRGDGSLVLAPLSELKAGAASLSSLISRYLVLGAEHILLGLDHLLFVLGLLLLQRNVWKLIQTITAFTIAHSITLGFAVLGIFPVPGAPIEVLIALSIAFLAREILVGLRGEQTLVHRRPWVVAFFFGLIHGFGFAGALGELGLSDSDIPLALLFFNLGVEAGQVAFILFLAAFYALFTRFSRELVPSLHRGLAYGLGAVATFWFLERLPALLPVA